MAQPPDDMTLSQSLDALSAQIVHAGRAQNSGPGFDVIRGQGVPIIIPDDEGEPGSIGRPRRASDTGTDKSHMTVWDRGEFLYSKAFPQGSGMPNIIRPAPNLNPDASLAERLWSLPQQSTRPKDAIFFPWGSVEALINEEEVVQTITQGKSALSDLGRPHLRELTDDQIREYAKKVCTPRLPGDNESNGEPSYRKIFALLVLLERGWEVVLFVDEGISDAALPLIFVKANGDPRPAKLRLADPPHDELSCVSHWRWYDHKTFENLQWSMLSPFFAKGKLRRAWFYQLSEKDVLPWIEEQVSGKQGGYSYVYRTRIHPSHHNFPPSELSDGSFAVKIFKADHHITPRSLSPAGSGTLNDIGEFEEREAAGMLEDAKKEFEREMKKAFEDEIETLRRFSGDDHPNLISLLAAFRHGEDYCVMFRWAHSDLKTLWMDSSKWDPSHPLSKPDLVWMLDQCRGMASGLQRIHFYERTETTADGYLGAPRPTIIYGRHGDIKPENILLFRKQNQTKDRGRLVITDFGLTRFHTDGTKTYFSNKDVVITLSYRPPECDMEGCVISRSFDIWSFGCVLLEFISWHLGGWTLVDKFVQARKTMEPLLNGWKCDQFFEMVRPEGETEGPVFFRVKIEVHQFVIKELHAHPQCSEPIHQLLEYIMEHMLVVESRDVQQRDDIRQVNTKLNMLHEMVAAPSYQLVASPWPRNTAAMDPPEAVEMPLNQSARQRTAARFRELREHTGSTRRLHADPYPVRRTQTHPPHGN